MIDYCLLQDTDLQSINVESIKTNKGIEYLNIESAFDIETTSVKLNDDTKSAFMYIWAFGLGHGNEVYYGRTWDQFVTLCKRLKRIFKLNKKKRLIIYVHNLSYEFQFMRKYFKWENIFAVGDRKPIKALTDLGIEFRDSYILSGYSLAKTAENLVEHSIKKLVGDLDYSLTRTSKTHMTKEEMGYLNNDIVIITAYIKEQIKQYQDITKIPLTNTGRVRTYVRNNCYYSNTNHRKSNKGKYIRYRKIMNDLTTTPIQYLQAKTSFMGGFTHANANHVGKVLENVSSIDFTSSYPSVMLAEQYPMSRGKKIEVKSIEEFEKLCRNYCLIFELKLDNVQSKISQENYISESKCSYIHNPIVNNGRVFSADSLAITLTNVDYDIIKQCYSWDNISIRNITLYHKGYLPKPIIESILKLYEDKTVLKGVNGSEVEYLLSKGMLNSVYGMCVTDIVKDETVYDGEWASVMSDVGEQIEKYNQSKNRFLYYQWGIFVTAYARKNLWTGIIAMGDDYVYSDTDSIKCLNYDKHVKYIEWYNQMTIHKLETMCETYKIDKSMLQPKTIKGVSKMIGVWDYEGLYSRFKTLGAKRYLVEEEGQLELTVAGLSKQNGITYMLEKSGYDNTKVFEMFNDSLYIPSERTGKMTHTYIDEPMEFMIQDYQGNDSHVKTLSGVHLENCDFTLSITKQYGAFINNLMKGYYYKGVKHI